MLRRVTGLAPDDRHAERGEESQQVERAPALLPGDHQNRGVEHGVIGEQRQRCLRVAAQQHRHGEPAKERDQRHPARVLQQGQRASQPREQDHQRKGRAHRHDGVDPRGGEDGEVHHRHAAALQGERKFRAHRPAVEANHQQRRPCRRDERQPCLDRKQPGLRGVAGEEAEAHEQDHQPNANDGVAAQQPVARARDPLLDQRRLARGGCFRDQVALRTGGGFGPGRGHDLCRLRCAHRLCGRGRRLRRRGGIGGGRSGFAGCFGRRFVPIGPGVKRLRHGASNLSAHGRSQPQAERHARHAAKDQPEGRKLGSDPAKRGKRQNRPQDHAPSP